jgi:ferrous iron transport protein A
LTLTKTFDKILLRIIFNKKGVVALTLDKIPECVKVKILSIKDSKIRNRLLGLGLIPESIVEVVRTSPMGDPRMYRVFNKLISMRNSEASTIEVVLLDDSIPLSLANDGEYEVVKVCGGKRFIYKISRLGILPGKIIQIKNSEIFVDNSKIHLGEGMKNKIILRRI